MPSPANHNRPFSLGAKEHGFVYSVAMKFMKDEEAAADVAQEALLQAHRHRGSFRGDSKLTTWLYRIAATTALMQLRKRKRRSREVLVPFSEDESGSAHAKLAGTTPSPEARIAAKEALSIVRREVERLGEKYRDIFWMRFYGGYTETEIAEQLNLRLTTVKTRAYRAKTKVRAHLATQLA